MGQLRVVDFELPADSPDGWRANAGRDTGSTTCAASAFDRYHGCRANRPAGLLCTEGPDVLLFMGFFAYQNWQQYQAIKR